MKKSLMVLALISAIFFLGCSQQETGTTTTTVTSTTTTTTSSTTSTTSTSSTTTTTTTSATTTTTYDSYFPLISGHTLTYEVITNRPINIGDPTTTYETTTTLETWQFYGYIDLTDSLEVFKVNVISGGQTTPYYYRENNTGLYSYGQGANPTTEAATLLRYPLEVGTTWEASPGEYPYTRVSSEEVVVTNAGSFLCKKIDLPYIGVYFKWYAKDVGLIKTLSSGDALPTTTVSREVISKNF